MLWVLQSLCFVTGDGDVGRISPSDFSGGCTHIPDPSIDPKSRLGSCSPRLAWVVQNGDV